MKTEIIGHEAPNSPVDWSKVRLVKYAKPSEEYIVLTNGEHDGDNFSGVIVSDSPDSYYKVGNMSTQWVKPSFVEVKGAVTIKFTPENE